MPCERSVTPCGIHVDALEVFDADDRRRVSVSHGRSVNFNVRVPHSTAVKKFRESFVLFCFYHVLVHSFPCRGPPVVIVMFDPVLAS